MNQPIATKHSIPFSAGETRMPKLRKDSINSYTLDKIKKCEDVKTLEVQEV